MYTTFSSVMIGLISSVDVVASQTRFAITPNPATSYVKFHFDEDYGDVVYLIMDILGQTVCKSDSPRLNVTGLPEGV